MSCNETETFILDNGSGLVKAGLSGSDCPSIVIPSIIGKPKFASTMVGCGDKTFYVGDEAQEKRGILTIYHVIDEGRISNFEHFFVLISHLFSNCFRMDPSTAGVLFTEPPQNPKENRLKMVEMTFESFNCLYVNISIQAVLALYSSGRTTGAVLDSGDGVSHVCGVYEGCLVPSCTKRNNVAGRKVTSCLQKYISGETGKYLGTSGEFMICQEIKKELCYIPENYDEEIKKMENNPREFEKEYVLPDGQVIILSKSRLAPNVLFSPESEGIETQPMQQIVYESVNSADTDVIPHLKSNIVCSGGTTMTKGIGERLSCELKLLNCSSRTEFKCHLPSDRCQSVFIGASILASLSEFKTMCLTQPEYSECGAKQIFKKCY